MSGTPPPAAAGRFPGFDALTQIKHWDPVTAGVVLSRIGKAPDLRFFTPAEEAVATALCDQLLDQHGEDKLPLVNMIDARLAEHQTDGWHYEDMHEDAQAWRETLASRGSEATARVGRGFAACSSEQQAVLIQEGQDLGAERWHGL